MSSAALPWEPVRIQKKDGELFQKKGNKVWLHREPTGPGRATVNEPRGTGSRKPFGYVDRDSTWPDLWVWVRVTHKALWIEYEWREREYARWKAMGLKPGRIPWRKR